MDFLNDHTDYHRAICLRFLLWLKIFALQAISNTCLVESILTACPSCLGWPGDWRGVYVSLFCDVHNGPVIQILSCDVRITSRCFQKVTIAISAWRCWTWVNKEACPVCMEHGLDCVHMDGVQNSRSQGLYGLRTIGIEKLSLHLRYEAGPIVNHQLHKRGARIALAWR